MTEFHFHSHFHTSIKNYVNNKVNWDQHNLLWNENDIQVTPWLTQESMLSVCVCICIYIYIYIYIYKRMCTHIWWQQIEKYVGQPLANESLCALVSDSPGWIRFAAISSHIHGWCFLRHLLPLFAMLVFPVCVALTLSSPVSLLTALF